MKAAAPVSPTVRAMQLKELQRRLQAASHTVRRRAEDKAKQPDTPAIKQQRRAVKKFDDANYTRERKALATAQKRIDAARNAILFGGVEKALAAVEALETEARDAR